MSYKQKELQQLIESKLVENILDEDFTDSDEEEISEIFILSLLALNEARYLEPRIYNVAKSQYWYNNILPSYNDIRFKKIMRMLPENFKALVNNLIDHPMFQSNNTKQQAPVELQLAVFLRRLGSKEDVFSVCSRYGIAEGTVLLFCKRIMKAIISLKKKYIKWPTEHAREFVHDGFKSIGGIEDIIGAVDGTHFILQNAPQKDKYLYFTRKKRYGFTLLSLIKDNDFLIGDSAYPLSPFLIKPFSNPNRNQAEFNRIFSSHRIIIEHAFGRLKNRFAGIREISVKKIPTAINMIDCSIILHNFLELRDDVWENQCESNEEEDNNELDNSNEENLKILGEAKRNWIMRKLFHPYNLY
ncbi:unnamed protein product [Rhizophagus irregularis]|uniref:DDE Tnp4 domain-containing protein n=1 Tax=Rhizophagus irregularis TaxID=588596 RepID=A0A915ZWM1_9GLOM|nr:unnamed protein product [Rhizophagus irregularis]CAB5391096.1 unnamed protein product [Rhizophagus irregularis]